MNRVTSQPKGKWVSGMTMVALLAMGVVIAGCGKAAASKNTDTKAFASAGPEIQADWDKIVTAVQSNDYATAMLTCRKLQAQGEQLTPEQRKAVNDTMAVVGNQLTDAAAKGDQNAINALDEVHRNWRAN